VRLFYWLVQFFLPANAQSAQFCVFWALLSAPPINVIIFGIMQTTPTLLALFSIVVTLAHQWQLEHGFDLPKAACYHKEFPTFVDALALVRKQLWKLQTFQMSEVETESIKVLKQLFNTWADLFCYAA
jgi:hypothetical protein